MTNVPIVIVCIGVLTPPQKHHPHLFLAKPTLKLTNCPSPLFLGNPPFILVIRETSSSRIWWFSKNPSKSLEIFLVMRKSQAPCFKYDGFHFSEWIGFVFQVKMQYCEIFRNTVMQYFWDMIWEHLDDVKLTFPSFRIYFFASGFTFDWKLIFSKHVTL